MSGLLQCQEWHVKFSSKKVCVFGYQEKYERLQGMGPRNKKIMLSNHIMFNKTSLLKSTVSQQVESMKNKKILQRVEDDVTPPSNTVSSWFSVRT